MSPGTCGLRPGVTSWGWLYLPVTLHPKLVIFSTTCSLSPLTFGKHTVPGSGISNTPRWEPTGPRGVDCSRLYTPRWEPTGPRGADMLTSLRSSTVMFSSLKAFSLCVHVHAGVGVVQSTTCGSWFHPSAMLVLGSFGCQVGGKCLHVWGCLVGPTVSTS